MPAKFLVWNIQNFTLNKIDLSITEAVKNLVTNTGQPITRGALNVLRKEYIIDTIRRADPDVFVLIEVISARGIKGNVVGGGGERGCLSLLADLRQDLKTRGINGEWNLVPPLKLVDQFQTNQDEDEQGEISAEILKEGAYTEGIGVFYRSDRMRFVGPYVWPYIDPQDPSYVPNDSPLKTPVPNMLGLQTEIYPAPWQGCLPSGTTNYAGQFEFFDTNSAQVEFPQKGNRTPFRTKFKEINAPYRTFDIFSVHWPPNSQDAVTAYAKLLDWLSSAAYKMEANSMSIITGDYNIDCFGDTVEKSTIRYADEKGYTTLFKQNKTMLKRRGIAYSDGYSPQKGLDNFAIRLSAATVQVNGGAMIVDRVAGTTALFPTMMLNPIGTFGLTLDAFRSAQNYGKLCPAPGTSDHMPMYIEL